MGGRGTFASGKQVAFTYGLDKRILPDGVWNGVKVLTGLPGTGLHDLPAESHTSKMYLKLHSDGTMNMLRVYGENHFLQAEIGYHPEPTLTGHHDPVLHIHYYDEHFNRTPANYLDRTTFEKYEQYMKGRTWYD
jgi:hypothetical protein